MAVIIRCNRCSKSLAVNDNQTIGLADTKTYVRMASPLTCPHCRTSYALNAQFIVIDSDAITLQSSLPVSIPTTSNISVEQRLELLISTVRLMQVLTNTDFPRKDGTIAKLVDVQASLIDNTTAVPTILSLIEIFQATVAVTTIAPLCASHISKLVSKLKEV